MWVAMLVAHVEFLVEHSRICSFYARAVELISEQLPKRKHPVTSLMRADVISVASLYKLYLTVIRLCELSEIFLEEIDLNTQKLKLRVAGGYIKKCNFCLTGKYTTKNKIIRVFTRLLTRTLKSNSFS